MLDYDSINPMNSKVELILDRTSGHMLKIFFKAKESIECDEPLLELGRLRSRVFAMRWAMSAKRRKKPQGLA